MTTDREVLAELLAIEDLKASLAQASSHAARFSTDENYAVIDRLQSDLGRRKPLAWAAARARLALPEAVRRECPPMCCGKPMLYDEGEPMTRDHPGDQPCFHCTECGLTQSGIEAPELPMSMFASKQNVKRLADEYADVNSIRTVEDYGTTHDKEMVREAMKRLHAAIDALAAPQINAPAPMSIKAKPLQWEKSGDDWHDKHLGFYVTHDPGDDPQLPYAAAWGEGDTQNFATLDEAKEWCQSDIDRWVGEYAINAPALPVAYVPVHPRNGPLWAMTTDTPDPQRLPSYPLMQLYADPMNAPSATGSYELRVAGPDDVYHHTDELQALRDANAINLMYITDRLQHPDDEVMCVATVHKINAPAGTTALPSEDPHG